jgi:hypothetical protein
MPKETISQIQPEFLAPLNASEPPRFLSRADAADYIHRTWGGPCAPQTLAKLAVIGGGPPFRKVGPAKNAPCVYDTQNLDEWVNKKISKLLTSTADYCAKK